MYATNNQFDYRMMNGISQTNKIYVDSYAEAALYQLAPSSSFILIDKTKPMIYEKTTDAYGGYSIRTFCLTENTNNKDDAITKSDLESIMARLAALEKKDTHEEV